MPEEMKYVFTSSGMNNVIPIDDALATKPVKFTQLEQSPFDHFGVM